MVKYRKQSRQKGLQTAPYSTISGLMLLDIKFVRELRADDEKLAAEKRKLKTINSFSLSFY